MASQTVVAMTLEQGLGASCPPLLAEEDASPLLGNARLQEQVAELVAGAMEVPPASAAAEVRRVLATGASCPTPATHDAWLILDPVDGTKGFIRGAGHHFSVGLALCVRDESAPAGSRVAVGVVASPHLPFVADPEGTDAGGESSPVGPVLQVPEDAASVARGSLFVAVRGAGCFAFPLPDNPSTPIGPVGTDEAIDIENVLPGGKRLHITPVPKRMTGEGFDFSSVVPCESYVSAHSSGDVTEAIHRSLGIVAAPIRVDSMVKYCMVAAGISGLYLRLGLGSYKENVWDHAPGSIIAEEAGAVVTDMHGAPFDFSAGSCMLRNEGVVVSAGSQDAHDVIVAAAEAVLL